MTRTEENKMLLAATKKLTSTDKAQALQARQFAVLSDISISLAQLADSISTIEKLIVKEYEAYEEDETRANQD